MNNEDPLLRRPLLRAVRCWRARHQHPFNFAIHLVGIPLAVAGFITFFVLPWESWYVGVSLFVLGYVLQYLGHGVEGNDLGEWAGIKRLLGWPFVSIAPQYQKQPTFPFPANTLTSKKLDEADTHRHVG